MTRLKTRGARTSSILIPERKLAVSARVRPRSSSFLRSKISISDQGARLSLVHRR
jgi:hypothetical protein